MLLERPAVRCVVQRALADHFVLAAKALGASGIASAKPASAETRIGVCFDDFERKNPLNALATQKNHVAQKLARRNKSSSQTQYARFTRIN